MSIYNRHSMKWVRKFRWAEKINSKYFDNYRNRSYFGAEQEEKRKQEKEKARRRFLHRGEFYAVRGCGQVFAREEDARKHGEEVRRFDTMTAAVSYALGVRLGFWSFPGSKYVYPTEQEAKEAGGRFVRCFKTREAAERYAVGSSVFRLLSRLLLRAGFVLVDMKAREQKRKNEIRTI